MVTLVGAGGLSFPVCKKKGLDWDCGVWGIRRVGGIIGLGVSIFASVAAVGQLDTYLQIGMAVFLGSPTPLTLLFLSLPSFTLFAPLQYSFFPSLLGVPRKDPFLKLQVEWRNSSMAVGLGRLSLVARKYQMHYFIAAWSWINYL